MKEKEEFPLLKIYSDRSELISGSNERQVFKEGKSSVEARARHEKIRNVLSKGYLESLIEECKKPQIKIENLSEEHLKLIESLVNSVTSEVGRAVVGLMVLQLTIKSILPEQSIRLHKASLGADFSWVEGVPMRTLDKYYFTPTLRKHDLLRLNADGIMMTRSLAENYPYSKLYKAAIRGAKSEWTELIDLVESGQLDSLNALKQMIVFLYNKSEAFTTLVDETLNKLNDYVWSNPDFDTCYHFVVKFIAQSAYSARMFEVAIHALMQVLDELKLLSGFLKPLSQMRSANKKHGNIGDIELTQTKDKMDILESWDAKYGKSYLRDELEELNEKLYSHPQALLVGFITDDHPNLKAEIKERILELETINDIEIKILNLKDWVDFQCEKYSVNKFKIGSRWLVAIAETICQKRREIAPIDEPTTEWVRTFNSLLPVSGPAPKKTLF